MSINSDENIVWGWEGNWGLVPVAVHCKIWKCSPLCCIALKCNIEYRRRQPRQKKYFQGGATCPGCCIGASGWRFLRMILRILQCWKEVTVSEKSEAVSEWDGAVFLFWNWRSGSALLRFLHVYYTKLSPLSCLPPRCISRISWYIQWDGRPPSPCGSVATITYI